jgi:hypothetical protein
MSNTIITPSIIARVALAHLNNNLVMGRKVYRDYSKEFAKVGDTISVRRPVRFTAQDGATAVMQDVTEGKFSLTMDKRKHVAWLFSTQDLTLSIEEYSKRYIEPAAIALANQIDTDLCGLYKGVWNWVGTPGNTVNSFADFAKAPERLDNGAVPKRPRMSVLSPADWWGMVGSQTSLFQEAMVKRGFEQGEIENVAGISTDMDQNIKTHTVGTWSGGSPIAEIDNGTLSTDYALSKDSGTMTIHIDGLTANTGTVLEGDVFTIEGINAVNPITKAQLPYLQQFVCRQSVTADGTGDADVIISPPIITSGPYQTVSAAAVDGANIVPVGTVNTGYPQNLVFAKNAFALVTADLEMPDGATFKARDSQDGYSLRVIKWYDGTTDEEKIRLDVLYGTKALYPDLATRLSGTP